MTEERIIRFPHRRSIGTLFVAPKSQPEEWELLSVVRGLVVSPENNPIKWEVLDEARGAVKIPADTKLKLKVAPRGSSLAPLADMHPDVFHTLDLSHSDLSDLSLLHVEKLSGLKVLELTSTDVSDRGMTHIALLSNLTSLGLSHSRISDDGLQILSKLKNLRELWLSSTDIDDKGLAGLTLPPDLVQLGLSGTKVSDEGLHALESLKSLIRVYLFNTKVTKEGVDNLKAKLPGCRIKWLPPKSMEEMSDEELFGSLDVKEDAETIRKLSEDFPILDFSAPSQTLDEKKFWEIINLLDWDQLGDDEKVIEPAVEELASMSTQDVMQFQDILSEKLYALDGEPFAREIGEESFDGNKNNFSKEWFLGVRCCAIANGKEPFEDVLKNPKDMPKDVEFLALTRIATEAYRRKTNKRMTYTTAYDWQTFSNRKGWLLYDADTHDMSA